MAMPALLKRALKARINVRPAPYLHLDRSPVTDALDTLVVAVQEKTIEKP